MNSFEAQDGKYDSTGVDGGEAIAEGDDYNVLHAVLLGIVVRTKAYNGSKSQAEGVEHLVCRIQPNCRLHQHLHLGCEHVNEPLCGSLEGDPPEEEDGQHEVGEHGREVDNLAGASDP